MSSITRSTVATVGSLLSLALLLTGCSERRTTVTGKVTYNGAVIDKPGDIIFVSKSGVQVPATISADGTYRATGVVVGENRVAIYYKNPQASTGKKLPKKGEPVDPAVAPPSPFLTPPEYASVETSKLTFNVSDPAVYNPELTGSPIP